MAVKNTNIYTDLDELPIYNFYKCIDGRLEYLYKSKEGSVNKEINDTWETLYNSYCEKENNSSRRKQYSLVGEIKWLEMRFQFAPILFNMLLKDDADESLIESLKQWGFKYIKSKDKDTQLDKFMLILNNSKSKLKRKITELEGYAEKNKTIKRTSLEKQSIIIKKSLGVTVDIFKDSVITWLAYYELIEEQKNNKNEQ